MRTANPDAPAKRKIVAAARELMLAKGYNDTSVDEICKQSGVAKGSFFHYFKDKEAVATAALECFTHEKGAQLAQYGKGESDPLERILKMIDGSIRMSKSPGFKGCLMGTVLQETSRTHPRIREACCAGLERGYGFFEKEFKSAKAMHAPKSEMDPRKMAEFFMSVTQGSFLLAKAQQNPKIIETKLKMLEDYLCHTFRK